MIPEKVIYAFIEDYFEENKIQALSAMYDAWQEITPEDLIRKWKEGAKEHGVFHSDSVKQPFEELKREVMDAINYHMIPRLLSLYRDG